jgi:RecB family endonuclease NucS
MIESLIKSSRVDVDVDVDVVLCESDSELDCEETVVIRYEVLGDWYLKCENDYVYDICSHDLLGRLDVNRGVIEYIE